MTNHDRATAIRTLSCDTRAKFRAERAELDRLFALDRDNDQAWRDAIHAQQDRHNRTRDQILALIQIAELLNIN